MKKIFSFLFLFTMYSVVLFAQAVDPSGAFTYSIPIEVPLGTGNLTPKISLYYNSNAGNGICGVGWNLAGLSAICRDASYAINFDAEDHYLLDGQKLIEINSTSTYQEYRTERESFLRIRGYHLNTAASYWEVASKSGQVMYYGRIDAQHGTSNDGHIDAVEKSGKARVWGISHMEDARGNYYYVTYWEDEENGDYYPLQIIYSQNDANRLTSMRTVSFSYEKRDDHYATYNPSMVDTDYRLKWIAVTTKTNTDGRNGKLIRKYRVDYEYSESTSRSRITGIQPYGSDGDIPNIPAVASSYGGTGTSLPATDIQWEDGKPGWESVPEYAPPYHFMSDEYNQDFSVRTVDFD
ncbi:SpvB/TcaC N-terminal domain-containing protein, partial [Sediminispirochaeta bajacaliforniensis]|uniref:SpvB/TcaC N-terminal domain-containing protein n=1 Tax=Sediminispirochaeta bajacaliforniensis TaxID=148 RepID=UPI0005246A8B